MAGETTITIVGNLTRDPELRTLNNGSVVANFTIASSERRFNRDTNQWEDGDTLFLNCNAWDTQHAPLASNIANSLAKGMTVLAQGRLAQRSYQAQDGTQRTVVELRVDQIGPSLRRATAQVTRQQNSNGGGFAGFGQPAGYTGGNGVTDPFATQTAADEDPWASEEPAF
ncbi:single-stranded DNA-binding protein [Bifidobacterium pseudolongum subsp. globosum]|uniref:Single-stranded DNA-binding protein n=1 Tax=Bifidobacterium pseudolongum subsp. globosum TaxID=1690 RepID=A0A4Q5AKM5_9BIFI|nr:single-stranded DNA-binding protein [Bifidobacterium pseudolongum]RYQ21444.1 single-stranded DNA-binding protein [Bifidobacterium pseudolongum subsp. globosum]RYQ30009.1 single-stranded DNA-binding protein [Bifidobacterium pseudolongum subsp. globosum]